VEGVVRFRTIVPGCHPGRYPHVSFEVYPSLPLARNYRNRLLSSQMAMPQGMIEAVYAADARYAESRRHLPRLPLGRDRVFADNSPRQLAALTPDVAGDPASGYEGAAAIGLSV
jgi:protocatechuate 3,4-dioxygenase beta subunit